MRVIVIVNATKDLEFGLMPTPELMAAMGAFSQALIDAGLFVDAGGLKDSGKGACATPFPARTARLQRGRFRMSANSPLATGLGRSRTSTRRSTG